MSQFLTLRLAFATPPPPGPAPFVQIATSVFGNFAVLIALDADGCVWQYQHNISANPFNPHAAWVRLGTARIAPEEEDPV